MKRILQYLLILVWIPWTASSQTGNNSTLNDPGKKVTEKKKPAFGIMFTGYVKTDLFFDTRQTVGLRDGHFLLFPENQNLDAEGKDINARANYNILSIQTRLAGLISGPDALGAKTSGYLEAEFFGNINPNINSFRLRHAYIKLSWPFTELMVGQWWHPMFVPECSPQTVSFNTGAPFVVFSRNPQVKIVQSVGKFKFLFTALSQVDFMSTGPDGLSSKYLRNSVIPEMNLQIQYHQFNEIKETEFLAGGGINYQILTPRLSSEVIIRKAIDTVLNNIVVHQNAVTETYKTTSQSSSIAAHVYAKLKRKTMTYKIGAEYGGNNNAYTMIGGYAVKSITDSARGFVDYVNLRSFAVWAEIHTNGTRWQPGIFAGFGKNLGAESAYSGAVYTRGGNIDYAYRISPRLVFNTGKVRLAGELEYTVAAYGKTGNKGYVYDTREVGNIRILIGVYYFF